MTDVSSPTITRHGLFQIMQAYKRTSLLRTGVELGVFNRLATGPSGAAEVADALGLDPRGTRILLNALAAIHLVECDGSCYWLAPGADRLLAAGGAEFVGDMVRVFASDWEWDALKNLGEAVRRGGTVQAEHAETPEYEYWEDFAAHVPVVAEPTANVLTDILEPWATPRPELKVLDVACGHGVYGFSVARRFARAHVTSLDWENVLAVAASHAERFGVAARTDSIAGDMFEVPLGGPYDLALVTNVLHHFSEERATALLTRVASVVEPGGRIGLVGFTTDDALPGDDPAPHLFSVLMLAWTFEGEVHSAECYRRMLAASGFGEPVSRTVPGLPYRVLVAERVSR
ncbi:class I SAM-dependent methyltransferase [Amycolatopsis anabasis]|uniref:class I SAM-dependent methyltransferase n=1 Tax=Amycolatopsis anabasis TaxID=1840409 RepID=UPI001C551433|nr:class I SAM-dependent methyltransferase [Amycolatopsis anabasis]